MAPGDTAYEQWRQSQNASGQNPYVAPPPLDLTGGTFSGIDQAGLQALANMPAGSFNVNPVSADQIPDRNAGITYTWDTQPGPPGGGGGGGGGGTTTDPYTEWLKSQEAARLNRLVETMRAYFNDNGMGQFVTAMEKYVRLGYEGDSLWVVIKGDPEYQAAWNTRFVANATRKAKGLSELLPSTYVQLEQSYKQLMIKHGVPSTLFDSPDDFAELIGNDVSPVEVNDRLQYASDYINFSGNENVKAQLRSEYGLSDSEMAAYMLDTNRTLQYLSSESRRNMNRANVGGAAMTQGVDIGKTLRDEIAAMFEASGGSGMDTFASSNSRFADVNVQQPAYARLGALSGVAATTEELVREQFDLSGAADVTEKKKTLASQERARFGGSSGLTRTSLSAGRQAR